MRHHNGAGPDSALTEIEARKVVVTAKRDGRSSKPNLDKLQVSPRQAVAIYDGTTYVGDVIERDDGAGFDVYAPTGKLIGVFPTRAEASRAIPSSLPNTRTRR